MIEHAALADDLAAFLATPEGALLREGAQADRLYSVQFCGHCLGDWLPDQSELIVDPALEVRPFDIVNIVLKRDVPGPWGEFMNSVGSGFEGVVKFYLGAYVSPVGRVFMDAQLAPPAIAVIPEHAIAAMHRVILAPGCGQFSERDAFTLTTLRPLSTGGAMPSINPDWSPADIEDGQWA